MHNFLRLKDHTLEHLGCMCVCVYYILSTKVLIVPEKWGRVWIFQVKVRARSGVMCYVYEI